MRNNNNNVLLLWPFELLNYYITCISTSNVQLNVHYINNLLLLLIIIIINNSIILAVVI